MTGTSLIILFMLLLGVVPTLGFFSPGSALVLLVAALVIVFIIVKKPLQSVPVQATAPVTILILLYAAYYYGGFYQPPFFKAIGQIVFFGMVAGLAVNSFLLKKNPSPGTLAVCYVLLALWTLFTSPHPHVDTVVVFKEAPLKLLHGINPYNTLYSAVYNNIRPDYYNHLPLSFLFYIPFAVLPLDERIAILAITVISFFLVLQRVPAKKRGEAVLPASLILFMPGSFYMLEHMYHDSIIFFFLCIAVYVAMTSEKLYFLFLSFFFGVKQNIILLLPFIATRSLLKLKNLLIFLLPFLIILVFILWNPAAFLKNTFFGLQPGKIPAPIDMSLTFPTLLGYLLPGSIPLSVIRQVSMGIGILLYAGLLLMRKRQSPVFMAAAALFISYYFSYYAFFNSYYLVFLLFLYDFIRETFLTTPSKPSRTV